MFLLWLWYMMPWIAAVVMARLCWRGLSGMVPLCTVLLYDMRDQRPVNHTDL